MIGKAFSKKFKPDSWPRPGEGSSEIQDLINHVVSISTLGKKLFLLVVAAGVVAGLGAGLFNTLLIKTLALFQTILNALPHPWLIALVPAAGGLAAGLVKHFGKSRFDSPCATDAMIEAIQENSHVPKKTPFVQMAAAALTIGSGGSCGRECPTAYIGTGLGSLAGWIIRTLRLDKILKVRITSRDERLLGICGAGAALGAIFRAPIGSALFATEVLYKYGLDFPSILPTLLSAIIGSMVFSIFFVFDPLFTMDSLWRFDPLNLLFAILAGTAAAAVGWIYIKFFYRVFKYSHRSRIPNWLKPSIGGLLHGLVVVFIAKEVWGMGYEVVQNAIEGKLAIGIMLLLVFAKIVSTSLTVATGGAGGVIAPSLFIGAMVGGVLGKVFLLVFHTSTPIGIYVVIGMASLYAAVGKVPLALPILIMESTRNLSLILPLFVASVIGYILSGSRTIYKSQELVPEEMLDRVNVVGDRDSDLLEPFPVTDLLVRDVETIRDTDSVADIISKFQRSDHIVFPVVDQEGDYGGTITLNHLQLLLSLTDQERLVLAGDVADKSIPAISVDENLQTAWNLILDHRLRFLPVIEDHSGRSKLVGIVDYRAILEFLKKLLVAGGFPEKARGYAVLREPPLTALRSGRGGGFAVSKEK